MIEKIVVNKVLYHYAVLPVHYSAEPKGDELWTKYTSDVELGGSDFPIKFLSNDEKEAVKMINEMNKKIRSK